MTMSSIETAAREFFAARQTRAGVVARQLMGAPAPDDAGLAIHLQSERRRRTRMDGSVEASLVQTTWTAWELLQLGMQPDHAGFLRLVGWVLARQNQPGRYGESCSEELHARGTCSHFLTGFFSPGPVDLPISPLTLPVGVTFRDEPEARFAASCFALQLALRARQERRQAVRDHVLSLLELNQLWNAAGGEWDPDLVFVALAAVAGAPLDFRERVHEVAGWVAKRQRGDGTWENAHPLHALDAMLRVPSDEAREAVARGVPVVERLWKKGELFSDSAPEEASLVGLRVLLAAG